jgi:YfiH family protein
MFKSPHHKLPLWQFDKFSGIRNLQHFVSCKAGGYSENGFGELNLSYKVGDDPKRVDRNRSRLAEVFGISSEKIIFPVQTHSNHIKIVTASTKAEDIEDTDAILTNEKGIMISVMSADCVPVLLYDHEKKVAAAIHAGWRGTMAEIVKLTVEKMKDVFDTKPSSIRAGIGPSISDEVYEVGEEVIKAVEKVYGSKEGIISREQNGKGFCNLWEANRIQLVKAGVLPGNIEVAGICTYKNSDTFFSYRKDGVKAGRFAAGLMMVDNN